MARAFICLSIMPENGAVHVLSGIVVRLKKSEPTENSKLLICDYFTNMPLWNTASGEITEDSDGVLTWKTRHTTYQFIEVRNLPSRYYTTSTKEEK